MIGHLQDRPTAAGGGQFTAFVDPRSLATGTRHADNHFNSGLCSGS